jgi:adenine-specific DNA-methyltransferase
VIKQTTAHDQENLQLANDPKQDMGFRSFKLAASNFKPWEGHVENVPSVTKTLELFADHVVGGRSAEEILNEILLKAGFSLTASVEKLNFSGKEVFSVAEGALLVCLDRELTIEVIEAMVERAPAQIVCLDAGFQRNDQLKVNAVQAIKSRARNEETTIVLRVV